MFGLEGKTAVVTGGSRGIGRACCRLLARAGAAVAFGYRQSHEAAVALLAELEEEGRSALAVSGDVSERASVERLFNEALGRFGRIDVVVGNAGIWKKAAIDEMSETEWQETIDVNLKSVYYTCQLSARFMKPNRFGNIILISSTAGQRGEANYSHYAASKGAIIALTKSLAAELGPWNIRVNAVAPGWVITDMSADVMEDSEYRASVESGIPLGRIATPEEIAGPVLFLASELAQHVHGEILNVNGGSVLCG